MLQNILEADKQERTLTQELEQQKDDIYQQLRLEKETLLQGCCAAARIQAEEFAKEETQRADWTIAALQEKAAQAQRHLEQTATRAMDDWVAQLTKRSML